MAGADMAKFTKEVEKLCTDCAADVGKALSSCKNSIVSRMAKFQKDLEDLEVPPGVPASDLAKIPSQVGAILKRENARYASILTFGVRVQVSGQSLSVPASGISGPIVSV